ncbi:MerR family transcriptional regulator [Roseibium denhamense]|uniref:MerR HTH family regulatory protein n=1 Tax=Roseibium denhamense TaxID=76305 RepID=A0ABY1P9V9_9HYPH|nr:MerR family transcriptional regulator [Roseibium denhamense]MTI07444.1 MerR family transcriptional regulator [Roseibium denhamense]SMP29763.1 MerR HTH family regulatory protein [Roseibium denhamense]
MSNRVDIEIPEYTQADVIRITSVSAKTLQNWTDPNRGILRLSQGSVGKGRRRLYSALDIMAVTMIAHLSGLGVSPNLVSQLFYEREVKLGDWFKSAVEDPESEHICRIYFDADGLYARLITSKFENDRYAFEDFWEGARFAFIQLSLSKIASFVSFGIRDIYFEETPEEHETEGAKKLFDASKAMLNEIRRAKLR